VQDISGPDMRKFERIQPVSKSMENAKTKNTQSVQPNTRRLEPETGTIIRPKLAETGFLLDWLSGGEVFQRNIQGFPLGFEALS
jgi:hypothetical protein